MEEWRPIEEYPGYSVSDNGRIRDDSNNVIRKTTISKIGYPVVRLNGKTQYVHRLECKAFLPNPDNKSTVNHKDGDRSNNDLSNLEWATYRENNIHGWRVLDSTDRRERARKPRCEYFGPGHIMNDEGRRKMSEAKKKQIICVETGKVYSCALEASEHSTVGKACITHACNGRCKTAGGYHWKYI